MFRQPTVESSVIFYGVINVTANPNDSVMQRYFAGLAESTFQMELGVADPLMVDYISHLLIRFVRNDVMHCMRSVNGRPIMSVPEMVSEASARLGDAKRKLHQHIGDFTLFWAGVYPEALRKPDERTGSDQFESYCAHGRRAYRIASSIETSDDQATNPEVLERLSEQFDLCCFGLREVRRQWEEGDGMGSGPILLN